MESRDEYIQEAEGTQRLQSFSDGVFSIAITLLVIDIKVPEIRVGHRLQFLMDLQALWPHLLSYCMSFFILGIIWANHHEAFRYIRRSNHHFLMINILFLMVVAFIPFPNALLAEALIKNTGQEFATVVYSGVLLLSSLSYCALWQYALRQNLIDKRADPESLGILTRSYLIGPVANLLALLEALYFSYTISLCLLTAMAMLYAIPSPKRPIKLKREGRS